MSQPKAVTSRGRGGIDKTLTREQVMAARRADVPITTTPERLRRIEAARIVAHVTEQLGFLPGELDKRCRKQAQMNARAALAGALHQQLPGLVWADVAAAVGMASPSHAVLRGRRNHPDIHRQVSAIVAETIDQ